MARMYSLQQRIIAYLSQFTAERYQHRALADLGSFVPIP
jgi:hypothetical protein